MSYRSGIMTNPGEGESAWEPGAWVTTDPERLDSLEFLDLQTFEAMAATGAIDEDDTAPKPPGVAELRATFRDLTGKDPAGMKKAELIAALEEIETQPVEGEEDDADSDR